MNNNCVVDLIEVEIEKRYIHLSYLYKLENSGEDVINKIYYCKGELNALLSLLNKIITPRGHDAQ